MYFSGLLWAMVVDLRRHENKNWFCGLYLHENVSPPLTPLMVDEAWYQILESYDTRYTLTCWLEAMVNVVMGMAIGTACMAAVGAGPDTAPVERGGGGAGPAAPGACCVRAGAGNGPPVSGKEMTWPAPSVPAVVAHCIGVPLLEMMVAKAGLPVAGRMGRPPYSGFSCGGRAMSMWSDNIGAFWPPVEFLMTRLLSVWTLGTLHRDTDCLCCAGWRCCCCCCWGCWWWLRWWNDEEPDTIVWRGMSISL